MELKMSKKITYLAAITLLAAPTFASAEGVAASLSASFGNNSGSVIVAPPSGAYGTVVTPTSVSVAGAAGGFAVATSVATARSSGAASGATDNSDLPPMAAVEYAGGPNAYETSVMFTPVVDTAAIAAQVCSGLTATQATSSGSLNDTSVSTPVSFFEAVFPGSVDDETVSITNGAITVSCN